MSVYLAGGSRDDGVPGDKCCQAGMQLHQPSPQSDPEGIKKKPRCVNVSLEIPGWVENSEQKMTSCPYYRGQLKWDAKSCRKSLT